MMPMETAVLTARRTGRLPRAEQLVYPLLITAFCLLYSSLYFFNTFPISESWTVYYVEMILRGNVPYRDFYYYLPPLNLLVDLVFWKLSFGKLLVYRGWYLLQRVVMLLLLYRILCRRFSRRSAFLAVSVAAVLLTACVYDLFGDYNQTMAFLAVLILYPVTAFAGKKSRVQLFLAGFILGLMFLIKQPIFAASCICWFPALAAYCLRERDRGFPGYFLSAAAGMAVPLGLCCLILAPQGALIPFLEQVYLHTEGKGGLLNILFVNTFGNLRPSLPITLVFTALFASAGFAGWKGLFARFREKIRTARWIIPLLAAGALLFLLWIVPSLCYYSIVIPSLIRVYARLAFQGLLTVSRVIIWFLTAVCIAAFLLGVILAGRKTEGGKSLMASVYLAFVLACAVGAAAFPTELRVSILRSGLFTNIQVIVPWVGILCLLACLYCTVTKNAFVGFLACGAFALYYSHAMGSGSTPPMNTQVLIISLPLVLCILFDRPLVNRRLKAVFYGGACAFCALAIVLCAVQKRTEPYSWWGQINDPTEKKNCGVSAAAMAGLRLTADEAEMYDQVTELILQNTDEGDEVWGYPYIRIFNILTERYALRTFVPVLFPDVVGDDYVLLALERIREHPPELVLWKDLPGCLPAHEYVFREGEPLKQRELEAEFQTLIPERYQLLGYYHGIQVYRLKEEGAAWVTGDLDGIIEIEDEEVLRSEANGGTVEKHSCCLKDPLSFDARVSVTLRLAPCEEETTVFLMLDRKLLGEWKLPANGEASELELDLRFPPASELLTAIVFTEGDPEPGVWEETRLLDLRMSCK